MSAEMCKKDRQEGERESKTKETKKEKENRRRGKEKRNIRKMEKKMGPNSWRGRREK